MVDTYDSLCAKKVCGVAANYSFRGLIITKHRLIFWRRQAGIEDEVRGSGQCDYQRADKRNDRQYLPLRKKPEIVTWGITWREEMVQAWRSDAFANVDADESMAETVRR
jgi:hypothetical protein